MTQMISLINFLILFQDTIIRFQEARETSNERGSEFIRENVGLLYYYFNKIDIKEVNHT